jgi:hypothetical protein
VLLAALQFGNHGSTFSMVAVSDRSNSIMAWAFFKSAAFSVLVSVAIPLSLLVLVVDIVPVAVAIVIVKMLLARPFKFV